MALWRKHRFISLEEQDGKDRIAAGSQFIVKRVGSTCVNDLDITSSEHRLIEFYKDLLDLFHFEHGCKLRLIVDLSGAVLYSKDGAVQKFELSNIRDVIYSTKKEEYCRYFILVAREESELTVKAHVLFCEDKQQAKLMYDTFIEVFTLAAEMRKNRRHVSHNSELKDTIKPKPRTKSESTNSSKDNNASVYARVNTETIHSEMPRRQTWTSSSMTRPRQRIEESQYELNDSFTELALSRTSSTTGHKSDSIDINSNRTLRQYSDVFM